MKSFFNGKILGAIVSLILILSFAFAAFHFSKQVHDKNRFPTTDLSERITYQRIGESDWKPFSIHQYLRTNKNENKIRMRIHLPEFLPGQNAIYIHTIDEAGKFFFQGKEIYHHGEWTETGDLRHFANFFSHLILLPAESSGKTIDVELFADWKSIGIYGGIELGNYNDLLESLYRNQLPNFAFAFFYFVIGIFSLFMFLLTKDYLLFYFSFTSLSLSVICLAEVDINLTYVLWHEFSAFLGLTGFFCMVLFFSMFLGEIFGNKTKQIMKLYSYLVILTYFYALFILLSFGFTREYCERFEIQGGIIGGIGAILSILIGFFHAYHKDLNARILLIGLFFFFTTFYQYILFQFGISEDNASDVHLRFFPIMISLVCMISIRYRNNLLRLKEYTQLLEESKLYLEDRVKEKTVRLEIANYNLARANKSKSDFFANVSHEFKTPLTLILSPLEKLAKRPLDEESLFLLMIIQRNSIRIQSLVDDLLAIAKIDFGEFPKEKIDVDLKTYFEGIADEFKLLCEEKGLQFLLNKNETAIYKIDKPQWDLILRNILSNAVKFTKSGSVILDYQCAEQNIEISVSDTGIGISEEELELVFERFYQSKRNRQISAIGTGIGLYLVKEMIRDCNGTIQIDSKINEGTKIKITLPIHSPDHLIGMSKPSRLNILPKPRVYKDVKYEIKKMKLMIVEDEPSMSEYLHYLLKDEFQLFRFSSIEDAMNSMETQEYDLILSDWTLPDQNGSALLKEVKRKNKNTPFLFLTARTEESILETAFEFGADDFIRKPFLAEDLISRVYQKINKSKEHDKDLSDEKDNIYGDIHDLLGGKLTDLILQVNQIESSNDFSSDKLKAIRDTVHGLSKELRNRLHDWEDFRNMEKDFELGWVSMLLRRYSNAGRNCRIILKEDLNWSDAEIWSKNIKSNIFRITQEFANNDLKYGSGITYFEINQLIPNFELLIKTKSKYQEEQVRGRGTRNLTERAEKISAKIAYEQKKEEFTILFFVPNTGMREK